MYLLEKRQRILNGQVRYFSDVTSGDLNRECLTIEPFAMTNRTRQSRHITAHLLPGEVAICLGITPGNVGQNAFKRYINITNTAEVIFIMKVEWLAITAIENNIPFALGQFFKRYIHPHLKGSCRLCQQFRVILRTNRIPWGNGTLS